jgi:hypothetical protein
MIIESVMTFAEQPSVKAVDVALLKGHEMRAATITECN